MIIGAVLGIIATLIYWQLMKLCQNCRGQSVLEDDIEDDENQIDNPNKFLFIHANKTYKEDLDQR